jgi:predicted cupin superfamily sugar epimerase
MNKTAAFWIEHLNLQPHPEGGFYKEVFRSQNKVKRTGSSAPLSACTSIYFLLQGADFSGFHRIKSDELWYFHKGSALTIHVIDNTGEHTALELSDTPTGSLYLAVPGGLWFASEIASGEGFTLVSCAVAPGFEFKEFEMADKTQLIHSYPQHLALLNRLCRS